MEYIRRDEIVAHVHKAERVLDRAISEYDWEKVEQVRVYLAKLVERGRVQWNEGEWGKLDQALMIVSKEPGITVRELAVSLDLATSTVKNKLKIYEEFFRTRPRTDRKGMYGRKPNGVHLTSAGRLRLGGGQQNR
jgi:hypothetical protein